MNPGGPHVLHTEVHGPAAEGKATAVPASTAWRANVFHASVTGAIDPDHASQAVQKAVATATSIFVVASIFLRVDRGRVTCMLGSSQQSTASICTRRQDRDLSERS